MSQQFTYESLLREEAVPQTPVECLGMMFENDEARRSYFLANLREGLEELHAKIGAVPFTTVEDAVARMQGIETWPMGNMACLREIAERMRHAAAGKDLLQRWKDEVGFPHGEIEDIISLSDPPYYTACPNPFMADFTKHHGKPYEPDHDDYRREPFAADVSEGKGDRNYFIHTYHVKIPPSAVTRFAQHYTEPGDVTLDCFCGSGMTALGVSLAHNNRGKTVMADLSPAATFISYFHSLFRLTDTEISRLENVTASLRRDYQAWYQTKHNGWLASANAPANWQRMDLPGTQVGTIKYVVWSDVVCCPICSHSATLWDFCVDLPKNEVKDVFPCPSCSAIMVKEKKYAKGSGAHLVSRVYETVYDVLHGKVQRRFKRLPVLISYEYEKRRYEKAPDPDDLACIQMAEAKRPSSWCPTDRMPEGDESRRNDEAGLTHVHHFFPARSLHVLADAFSLLRDSSPGMLGFATSIMQRCTWQNRYMPQHRGNRSREVVGPLSGTLYIPSFSIEINPVEYLHEKGMSNLRLLLKTPHSHSVITTQSASSLFMILPDCSIDYAFIDPPFGANLQYSELNFIMEAWLKVWTSNRVEAVVNQKRLVPCQFCMCG